MASSSRALESESEDDLVQEMEEEEERMNEPEEPQLPRGRAKRRTLEVMRSDRQKKWEEGMKVRHAKNERHIDVDSFRQNNRCIRRIDEQGLSYFFGPNPGYNKALVREFYKHMRTPDAGTENSVEAMITSRIGKIPIEITPDVIASALNYVRPSADLVNYPRDNFTTAERINQALYINPADAGDPHVPGKFKENYTLLNQVVHFNLNPRGTENKPSLGEGCMLYAFMRQGTICDWAKYIFKKMFEFKAIAPAQTRMPFPCLVTKICKSSGVRNGKYVELEKLNPGILNSTTLTKSISQSRVSRNIPGGNYLTTMPPRNAKKPVWGKLLFCQNVVSMGCLKKIKKETRDNARRQRRLDHKMDWLQRRQEGSTSEPYALPPMEPQDDSDDFAGGESDFGE